MAVRNRRTRGSAFIAALWVTSLAAVRAQWTQLWSDPTASDSETIVGVRPSSQLQPSRRAGHAMVQFDGYLYVFGGGATPMGSITQYKEFDDTWRFDLQARAWTEITGDASVRPAKRVHHASALRSYADGVEMVIFGGISLAAATTVNYDTTSLTLKPSQFNDVWRLSLRWKNATTEQWTRDLPDPSGVGPSPRSRATAVVYNDKLIVFGGISMDEAGKRKPTDWNDLWSYDLTSCKWSLLTPIDSTLPNERYAHSMVTLTDAASSAYLLVWGGRVTAKYGGVQQVADTWLFSLDQRKWIRLSLEDTLRVGSDATLVMTETSRFWVFGGFQAFAKGDNVYSDTRTVRLSFPAGDFSELEARTLEATSPTKSLGPSSRHMHRAAVWGDMMVLYGGMHDTRAVPPTMFGEVWTFNTTSAVLKDDHDPASLYVFLGAMAGGIVGLRLLYVLACRRRKPSDATVAVSNRNTPVTQGTQQQAKHELQPKTSLVVPAK